MSDILIKGMEMPKNCQQCPFIHSSWWFDFYCGLAKDYQDFAFTNLHRMPSCPLVEIPTPNGNLKDESDIISLIEVMFCKDKDEMEHAIQCVKDAPTVIEAEGSEE